MANELARPSAAQAMQAFVMEQVPRINKVAGKHLTGERLTTLVGVAMTKTPALAQCDKLSILQACMYAGRLGLEPNTPLQHAYFIPYGGTCQLQIGYRGMVELVRRSGFRVQSEVVYANDDFEVSFTSRPPIKHKPKIAGPRGEIIGAWAMVWHESEKYEDATPFWMPIEEIQEIKRKSSAKGGPWSEPAFFAEMVRKTVIKRACKHTPMNELVSEAAAIDDGERIPELEITVEQQATRGDQIAAELGVASKPVENTAKPSKGGKSQNKVTPPPAEPAPSEPPAVATAEAPDFASCVGQLAERGVPAAGAKGRCSEWLYQHRNKRVGDCGPDDFIALAAAIQAGDLGPNEG